MKEFFESIHFVSDGWLLVLPCLMIGIDFLTGCIYAWLKKIFSSKKLRSGLSKKVGEIVIIIVGELLTYGLELPHYIMAGISGYIIFMEIISILENLAKMGVPLPTKIKEVLNNNPEDKYLETLEEIKEDKKK